MLLPARLRYAARAKQLAALLLQILLLLLHQRQSVLQALLLLLFTLQRLLQAMLLAPRSGDLRLQRSQ